MKKFTLYISMILSLIFSTFLSLNAQDIIFTSSDTYTVTVTSTYSIKVWAGGGRGGRRSTTGEGGGGGGGAFSSSVLTLNPGTYTIHVGMGGNNGDPQGGNSWFSPVAGPPAASEAAALVKAVGGTGVADNISTGGAGGAAGGGVGSFKASGGTGANGTASTSGGGGGSGAGTSGNGINGSGATGGSDGAGGLGDGGNGGSGTGNQAGIIGSNPGGGGGGAKKSASGNVNGGQGGDGMIILTPTCVPVSISVQASDLTVECDGAGNAADLAAWLGSNGGAVAINGCGDLTWTNDYTILSDDCGATGSATVTFTVTDDDGNTATTSATFTIEDTTAPDAVCQDVTIEFDAYGNASTTAEDVDNGSSDACGDVTLSIDQTEFNCTDLGANTITLTVTDDCGNTSTCTATVTVVVPTEWTCAPGPRIESPGSKVIFCHVPPGYPADNLQVICVSRDIETICDHLGHGDHFGYCDGEESYQQIITDTESKATRDEAAHVIGDNELNKNATAPLNLDTHVQPNPFSAKAKLQFHLAQPESVVLKVYNNMGQEMSTLHTGRLEAGQHSFEFDGTNQSEGLYYFSLIIGNKVENVRMILER